MPESAPAPRTAWNVSRPAMREKKRRFEMLYVVAGRGRLRSPDWPDVALNRGLTVLVPACVARYEIVPTRALTLVRAAEPE